jgi:crossover junction endodeoxyribonuclease RusA
VGEIRIRVNGEPAPQGSKRHFPNGGMVEMSKKVAPWREAVRSQTQLALADGGEHGGYLRGPVFVGITFYLHRPASHFGTGRNAGIVKLAAPARPCGKPDLDKLIRSTLDGLKTGGAYGDDAQVVAVTATKWYAAAGQPPGAGITIELER